MPLKIMISINEQEQVKKWLQAEADGDRFPVDFDIAWTMAGYSKKSNAKRKLTNQSSYLVKDEDYKVNPSDVPMLRSEQWTKDGRLSDRIVMSCDAFKHFCLMAQTAKGREIRQYFIEAEKGLAKIVPTCQLMNTEILQLKEKIADLEWEKANPYCDDIPQKFVIHAKSSPKTTIYTVCCRVQDDKYIELMHWTMPIWIYQESDFDKYCQLAKLARQPLNDFVDLLNRMSHQFTPTADPVIGIYYTGTKH